MQVPRGRIPTEQVLPLTENSGLAGVMAAAMVPVFTSPPLATVKATVLDLPVVAAVDPAGSVTITNLAGAATIAVIAVNLVQETGVAVDLVTRLDASRGRAESEGHGQVAPLAGAPGAAVVQLVVVESALTLPAD